ncbi:hypothetical protein HGO37_07980 [Rhizobium sp. CG4]|uniref:DUF6161 domain-containing protein n=1 Tax=Rhizobium sp. CG4 TaxID=2726075 RepID=UPI0020347799|nr:DUF6161 domain-containing protein [Rhizobium sp. CG4]MCM2455319.1 hypothetical protein [Rhizobium sp. CG4]
MQLEIFQSLKRPFEEEFAYDRLSSFGIETVAAAYSAMSNQLRQLIADRNASPSYIVLVDKIEESAQAHLKHAVQPGHVQKPSIPALTDEGVAKWMKRLRAEFSFSFAETVGEEIVVMALAAFAYETKALWVSDQNLQRSGGLHFPLNFTIELESYGFWKGMESKFKEDLNWPDTRKSIEEFTEEQVRRIDTTIQYAQARSSEVDSLLHEHREAIAKIYGDTTKTIKGMNTDIEAQSARLKQQDELFEKIVAGVSTAEDHVKAFAKAVREELKVDATKKLWNHRATDSARSFWVSAGLIAFAIIYPPFWVFKNLDTVLLILAHVSEAATTALPNGSGIVQNAASAISRLVIISAPLALYFWSIKLLVRFNMRSLALMDDAHQRQTTMDTYFHLVENNKVTAKERGLMLNALFRPLPGQGQDNVEPPNFVDLIGQRKE